MDISQKILSDLTVFMKYAKYLPDKQRRETWEELIDRNKAMHLKKFPELKDEIESAYELVYAKKILPSMRSLQFAGKPIEINPTRIYNCCFLPIDDWRAFSEIMFLLLGGTGVGYSVQNHHVEKLPEIRKPKKDRSRRWLIGDNIEGWADSIKVLMKSYFQGGPTIKFDFGDIRQKGVRLITSGGKAPGPQPLKECLLKIEGILENKSDGDKLKPIEVHDIICYIADAVLAGGIRRAALISLFNADDDEMISCKSGEWWEMNPQRGRANNSAVLLRHKISKNYFLDLWKRIENSNAGEPGIYLTNDKDWGTNPCIVGSTKILTNKGFIEIQKLAKIYKKNPEIRIITQNKGQVLESSYLKWCGITQKNDNIYRINFSNGSFQLVNLKHKYYLEDYSQIEVSNIIEELKNNSVSVRSYSGLVEVMSVVDLKYVEDVYDLTADPNYNFFGLYDCDETFSDTIIRIDEKNYYPFDVISTARGNVFAKDLIIGDEIYS